MFVILTQNTSDGQIQIPKLERFGGRLSYPKMIRMKMMLLMMTLGTLTTLQNWKKRQISKIWGRSTIFIAGHKLSANLWFLLTKPNIPIKKRANFSHMLQLNPLLRKMLTLFFPRTYNFFKKVSQTNPVSQIQASSGAVKLLRSS